MKILVTGGGGYVGTRLVNKLRFKSQLCSRYFLVSKLFKKEKS